jgi:hypothetical protein
MAIPIGTIGTIPTLTVGGRVLTDLTNLITLYAPITTSGHYTTARQAAASAGYTPSGSKAFKVAAMVPVPNGGASSTNFGILYGNTDVGFDSASAPTSPIYPGGFSTAVQRWGQASSASSGSYVNNFVIPSVDFVVPNGKYLAVVADNSSCNAMVYGYEQ